MIEFMKREARGNRYMKIHIIGGSGSGKTYLAENLSKKYGIRHYDLDDLQWDNDADIYGVKRSKEERGELLEEILKEPEWIIEGVYYKWVGEAFAAADVIYVLNVPLYVTKFRIIKRFCKRKLGLERGKKETLKSLLSLLRWTEQYQKEDMVQIQKMLEPYREKCIYE